jgi:Tfp pilus assembly protein FimT
MNRRAVTLAELLLVVVLIGIGLGIAAPRVAAIADRAALRTARADLLRALDATRGAAIRLGHPAELVLAGSMLQVHGPEVPPLWRIPAPEHAGVELLGLTTPIRFGPSGIAMGVANRTLRLRRGDDTLEVVLSRLGRVR